MQQGKFSAAFIPKSFGLTEKENHQLHSVLICPFPTLQWGRESMLGIRQTKIIAMSFLLLIAS